MIRTIEFREFPTTPRKQKRRRNAAIANVLDAMRRGNTLHLSYKNGNPNWHLTNGLIIPNEIAKYVCMNSCVSGVGDALFTDVPAQTWRFVNALESSVTK